MVGREKIPDKLMAKLERLIEQKSNHVINYIKQRVVC